MTDLLAIGDSITAGVTTPLGGTGYVAHLAASGFNTTNLAIGGSSSDDWEAIASYCPGGEHYDIGLVMLGINDAFNSTPPRTPAQFEASMLVVHGKLLDCADRVITLQSHIDPYPLSEFHRILQAQAVSTPRLRFLDPNVNSAFLHPTTEEYAEIAAAIEAEILAIPVPGLGNGALVGLAVAFVLLGLRKLKGTKR